MKKIILLALMLALCVIPTLALAVDDETGEPLPDLPGGELLVVDEASGESMEEWDRFPLGGVLATEELAPEDEPAPEEALTFAVATPGAVINEDMLLLYLEQYNSLLMLQVAVSVAAVIAILLSAFSKEWLR